MTPPPISREGLARCPSCLTHVAVAPQVSSTVCPFCGGSFASPSAGGARAASSALVAALGLGLALTGCGPKGEPAPTDPAVPAAREPAPPVVQPAVYGGPPRDDPPPMPIEAPPADTDTDTDTDTDDAAEVVPTLPVPPLPTEPIQIVPLYGVAPMPVPVRPPVQDKPKGDR
jgi:hypothetical protein